MLAFVHTTGVAAFFAYSLAASIFLASVARKSHGLMSFGLAVGGIAFLLQTLALIGIAFGSGISSLVGDGGDYYFLFSWAIAMSFLIGSSRFSFPVIGAMVMSAVVLSLGASSYLMHAAENARLGGSSHPLIVLLHVVPALCAEVNLFFAFVVSVVYLVRERRIRRKHVDEFLLKGPSLERLNFLQGRFVLIGFIAMSFAVISGVLWGVGRQVPFITGDLSQWAALVAWVLLGIIVLLRRNAAWSTRRISGVTALMSGSYFLVLLLLALSGGGVLHAFERLS